MAMAGWYLLLCALFCLMDARPASPDSALPVHEKSPAAAAMGEKEEFWTRWNSDKEDHKLVTIAQEQPSKVAIFTEEDGLSLISKVRRERIVSLDTGCGRSKNRLATLFDGTKLCCRYREWRDIRGEFYANQLNSYLGMFNAPPATIIKVNFSSPQWVNVAESAREAGWADGATILVTLYVEDLVDETFPLTLREGDTVVTKDALDAASPDDKHRFLQWSDMIVFDFVIGHSDRIFNNLFNLQWNDQMLRKPIHNLLKTKHGSNLLLFDNESGFWLGYKMGWNEPQKYELQERYLKRMCVFRDRTVERVKYLLRGNPSDHPDRDSPLKRLEKYIKHIDRASFQMVEPLMLQQGQEFERRLGLVLEQVEKCARGIDKGL